MVLGRGIPREERDLSEEGGERSGALLAFAETDEKDWKGTHVGPVLPERAP